MGFQKAVKTQSKLRLAITGPSGSGKTYTALRVACALAKASGGRVAVLDSEHGSASKYGDVFDFDTDPSFGAPYHPEKYMAGIREAETAGYAVLVVDSLSHAWAGQGGLLEVVDKMKAQARHQMAPWATATPIQQRLIEAIVGSSLHIIVTMRSKTEWALDQQERNGKMVTVPKKIGTAPVQRDGMEYEFDVSLDLDRQHVAMVSKTRCSQLDENEYIEKPGEDLAAILLGWLSGAPAPAKPAPTPAPEAPAPETAPAPEESENPAPPAEDPAPAPAPKGKGKAKAKDKPASADQLRALGELAADQRLAEGIRQYIRQQLDKPLTGAQAGAIIGRARAKLAEAA